MATPAGVIVLAGGRSARMGAPKEWLDWGGRPMLAHVASRMAGLAPRLIVVRSAGQELPPLPAGVEVVDDAMPGRGPLEGLRTGLDALGAGDVAVVCAGDMPLLAPALLARAARLLDADHDAVVAWADGRPQPLAGAYRAALRDPIAARLAEGRGSLVGLLGACRTRRVVPTDHERVGLAGANTPAALQVMREKATTVPAAPSAPSGSQASAVAPASVVIA